MERSLKIREAVGRNLGAIVALLADDALERGRECRGERPDDAYLESFERIERNHLVVAEDDGRVVGALQITYVSSLTHHGGERARVEGVRVAAGSRGEGVGRFLLGWAVARASERGCRMVQPATDKRRPEAHGFEATREGTKLHLVF